MLTIGATLVADGKEIGQLLATKKEFKTGSRGFYGNGKLVIGEKRYQCSLMLIEIGSKPEAPAPKKK